MPPGPPTLRSISLSSSRRSVQRLSSQPRLASWNTSIERRTPLFMLRRSRHSSRRSSRGCVEAALHRADPVTQDANQNGHVIAAQRHQGAVGRVSTLVPCGRAIFHAPGARDDLQRAGVGCLVVVDDARATELAALAIFLSALPPPRPMVPRLPRPIVPSRCLPA